jgi:hypothetical protein
MKEKDIYRPDEAAHSRAVFIFLQPMNPGTRAVLKSPHSIRWRDGQGASDFAERLDCSAFTAAFGQPKRLIGSGVNGVAYSRDILLIEAGLRKCGSA